MNFTKAPDAKHKLDLIKNLRNNDSIKLVPLDKGNGIAVLNTDDYYTKLNAIIDSDKFAKVTFLDDEMLLHHPIVKQQNKLKCYLNKHVKPHVDCKTFDFINPIGSNCGKLYGTAKVHKQGTPLRPIVASHGTSEYNLAKYLNQFITPIIDTEFSVQSNSQLIDAISKYQFSPDSKLVSFDIENLFTNVPMDETINIACEKVYNGDGLKPPFNQDVFRNLLKFATGGIFSFNDTLYVQRDGLAMGSPLAPTLSNLFVGSLERKYLKQSCRNVKFYARYVDDILVMFEDDDHSTFLDYINSWHDNLKFTVEIGMKSIPFLDINLDIESNVVNTTVYRKPTYTNLVLNYAACCPLQWKRGLLLTLINRAYVVCNSWLNFHNEIDKLSHIFKANGYPSSFILDTTKKFLDKKFSNPSVKSDQSYSHVVKIPFFGQQSLFFKKRLQSIFNRIDPDSKVRWVFTCTKLKSYFSNKDRTPLMLKSGVVYCFTCEVDPRFTYIGKTLRHLNIRVKEHKSKISAIFDHRLNCSCRCNPENFKILASDSDGFALNIKEAFYIKKLSPKLNKQVKFDGSFYNCRLF